MTTVTSLLPAIKDMPFHPDVETLSEIMATKAQNTDKQFFRVAVSYYMAVMASMMRTNVATPDSRILPVNMYAIGLAPSGSGKGLSTTLIEQDIICDFEEVFINNTMELKAEQNFPLIATKRASKKNSDPETEMEKVRKDWERLGPMLFSFDSGTTAALRQTRHKLKMSKCGALCLQVDEIGDNLLGNKELLPSYLELFDAGQLKQKLVKNTDDNLRMEDIPGATPANMLLFGTPTRLFDGGKTEEEFMAFLDAGFARRSFFAYVQRHKRQLANDVNIVFDRMIKANTSQYLVDLRKRYQLLADSVKVGQIYEMQESVFKQLLQYKINCEAQAEEFPEHEEMLRAEMAHRYSKVLKLATVYAFIDEANSVKEEHLYYAIKLAEESGKAFHTIVKRDKPHVRLAKYLAGIPDKCAVTHSDLVEDLKFYPQAQAKRNDLLQLAIGYGYRNNIIIKKSFDQGIEFLHGETLEPSDLDKIIISYSTDIAEGYTAQEAPWHKLHKLTQQPNLHWINHATDNGHRIDEHIISGFNMVVLDIDGTATQHDVKTLLKDYTFMLYTTKRNGQEGKERFRLLLPINYILKLSLEDYKQFMVALTKWLPFKVDEQTFQRSRKWLTHTGSYYYNEGQVFDVIPFIPRTEKAEQKQKELEKYQSLEPLEAWMLNNTGDGNRNSQLLKYALVLLDLNHSFDAIRTKVLSLNDKLPGKLDETEILSTIMVTVGKRLAKQP